MSTVRAFALTRAGSLDPAAVQSTLQKVGQAFSSIDEATFLAFRESGTLRHLILLPASAQAEGVSFQIARAVQAQSDPCDLPDLSATGAVVRAQYDVLSIPSTATQSGGDIRVVSQMLSTTLRDGEWAAVTIRKPSKWTERKWYQRWISPRATTHHSLHPSAMVTSFTAGGADTTAAERIVQQTTASLPGWDNPVVVRSVSGAAAARSMLGVVAGLGAAAFGAAQLPQTHALTTPLAAAAVAFILAAFAVGRGWLPLFGARALRGIRAGRFPAPAYRLGRFPRPPKGAHSVINQDGTVSSYADFPGDYPLSRRSFMVGPLQAIAVAAPHAGAASGASVSTARPAPPVLREQIGAYLGTNEDKPVYLSEKDRAMGLFCTGLPGSGKTQFLASLWGFDAFARTHSAGPRGGNALVWFDTKMDSQASRTVARLSSFAADEVEVIRVGDASAMTGLELLPQRGTVADRGRALAAMFKSVFGEQAIAYRSQMTLRQVFTGGFATAAHADVVAAVPGLEPGRSPLFYADVLLGNKGKALADSLQLAIEAAATKDAVSMASGTPPKHGQDLVLAAEALRPFFEETEAKRRELALAPRSKTDAIMLAEHWWSRRWRFSWEDVLRGKAAVVIDFGGLSASTDSDENTVRDQADLDKELRDALAAMMLYTLRTEIERVCAGWDAAGQAVSVYADEVKFLAGADPATIAWFRDDARSFGVRAHFATQYPEQLPEQVRKTLMGLGTLVSLAQSDPGIVTSFATQFSMYGQPFSPEDIATLGRFEAVVKTTVDGAVQPAFTAIVAAETAFALDRDQFAAIEGFSS